MVKHIILWKLKDDIADKVSVKADLGTSPISGLPYAASEVWPVSAGVGLVVRALNKWTLHR